MDKIKVALLNPEAILSAETMLACAARLTQGGHKIKSMSDFFNVYYQPYTADFIKRLSDLPHPTLQKFSVVNVVVIGASRRFLAQITRHQNEVKFMSASLQYSNYMDAADFVVPYNLLNSVRKAQYISQCKAAMQEYKNFILTGLDNDSAGYLAPQGLRNVLIISATPYQWKHMIGQRVCRRNTDETRYVMLRIWEKLFEKAPELFDCGPFCMHGLCKEGRMSCQKPLERGMTPTAIIDADFPLLSEVE